MASITQVNGKWRALIRRQELGRPLCKTFKLKADARAWARAVEAQIDGGGDPSAGLDMTMGEAIRHFRKIRAKGNPVRGSLECRLKVINTLLGTRTVGRMSFGVLREYCEERRDAGVCASTVLGEVTCVGTLLSEVGKDLNIRLPDVVNRVTRKQLTKNYRLIGPANERDRRPQPGELERVLAHMAPRYQAAVLFAVSSAMRRGEIVRLRWQDLDREHQTIICRQRKHPVSRKDAVVPLLLGAYEVLAALPPIAGEDRIFPFTGYHLGLSWRLACRATGVVDLRFHDLRHEAISRLFELGYGIAEVAAVSGHRSWTQLKRYTNLRPGDLKHGPASVRALKAVA
jgi:integrase